MLSLCDVCSSAFADRNWSGPHHLSFQALARAADDGCYLCIPAYLTFSTVDRPFRTSKDHVLRYKIDARDNAGNCKPDTEETYVADSHESFRITFFWVHLEPSAWDSWGPYVFLDLVPYEHVELKSLSDDEVTEANQSSKLKGRRVEDRAPRHVYLPPLTRDALPLASRWLEECRSNHSSCTAGHESTWKPKRLLHCMNEMVRLVKTEHQLVTGYYAAISHCWGAEKDFLVLGTTNADQLRRGIPQSWLPNNFQDVILVAKELGIEYVWVDCLCILQNGEKSADDWRLHASDMTNVYENCVLTIATHSAESPTKHSLIRRKLRLVQEPRILWHGFCQETALYNIFLWHVEGYNALLSSPLAARAWVFQERLLAPRVLHIGTSQLFWECKELPLATESFPSGIPQAVRQGYRRRPFSIEKREHRARREDDGHSVCPPPPSDDAWNWLVTGYSQCFLTYPSKDKLIALAGITRRLSNHWDDEYVCGFFRSDLLWHLMWTTASSEPKRWEEPYIAPTWSWLCIDGAVNMCMLPHDGPSKLLAKVQEVKVQLVDPTNPWGAIQSASLVLYGPLLPIALTLRHGRAHVTFPHDNIETPFCGLDINVGETFMSSGDFYAILVVSFSIRSRPAYNTGGLVLQLLPNRQEFQRIGTFWTCRWSLKDLQGRDKDYRVVEII